MLVYDSVFAAWREHLREAGAKGLVGLVFFSLLMAMAVANTGPGISLAFGLPSLVIMTLVVLRFGLFAFIVMNFVMPLLDHMPLTFDPGVWYAGFSWFTLAAIGGLAFYGFRVAVAGRPVFEGAWISDS